MKIFRYDEPIEVLGVKFSSVREMIAYARKGKAKGGVYVREDSQRYPYFDSEDYASENRYYTNLVFGTTPEEADHKLYILEKKIQGRCNYNKLTNELHPMIYWGGDTSDNVRLTETDELRDEEPENEVTSMGQRMDFSPLMQLNMLRLFLDYRDNIDLDARPDKSGMAEFLGREGMCGRFRIKTSAPTGGRALIGLLVAHEGDWLREKAMSPYPLYENYEDVQPALGTGLYFRGKEYSQTYRRSLFLFTFSGEADERVLAVPATGEEIAFEIYGIDSDWRLLPLLEMEL